MATRYKHLTVCHTLFWCLFAPRMSEGVEWPSRHARSRFTLEFDHSERIVAAHLRTEASWGHSSMCGGCTKMPETQKGQMVRSHVTWSLGLVAWRIYHIWYCILGGREATYCQDVPDSLPRESFCRRRIFPSRWCDVLDALGCKSSQPDYEFPLYEKRLPRPLRLGVPFSRIIHRLLLEVWNVLWYPQIP